jgi:hypothetical protein
MEYPAENARLRQLSQHYAEGQLTLDEYRSARRDIIDALEADDSTPIAATQTRVGQSASEEVSSPTEIPLLEDVIAAPTASPAQAPAASPQAPAASLQMPPAMAPMPAPATLTSAMPSALSEKALATRPDERTTDEQEANKQAAHEQTTSMPAEAVSASSRSVAAWLLAVVLGIALLVTVGTLVYIFEL